MLNQQTTEKLYAMRMRGMADAFTQQQEEPQTSQLSFEERFAITGHWNDGSKKVGYKALPASKISISARRGDSINKLSGR
jgi:hypothetical protein